MVVRAAMPWLADIDVGAVHGFARSIGQARTEVELGHRALRALSQLVPADVVTWDRVELATGAIHHETAPIGAEPPGSFRTLVEHAADHPLLAAHAARRRPAVRLSELVERSTFSRGELYGDLLHAAGVEYEIAIGVRSGRGETVVAGLGRTEREFSERDRDLLDLARPGLEGVLRATQARERLVRALADEPPPGTAVMLLDRNGEIELSSPDAGRWLAEQFGASDHPGWLPRPVAEWLALPPRPLLMSERDGRRLHRLPGAWRPARTAARGDRRELPSSRPRAARADRARDRGAARGRGHRGRGRTRVEAVPEPSCGPRAARARAGQARRAHGRRRRRSRAPREPVEPVEEYAQQEASSRPRPEAVAPCPSSRIPPKRRPSPRSGRQSPRRSRTAL